MAKCLKVLMMKGLKKVLYRFKRRLRLLTKQDSMVVRKQQTKGLGLSKIVLEKIFSKNYLKRLSETN